MCLQAAPQNPFDQYLQCMVKGAGGDPVEVGPFAGVPIGKGCSLAKEGGGEAGDSPRPSTEDHTPDCAFPYCPDSRHPDTHGAIASDTSSTSSTAGSNPGETPSGGESSAAEEEAQGLLGTLVTFVL